MSKRREGVFDLEERTAKFGEEAIDLAKKIPKNLITAPLINQLVKASSSVGANYCEADCAESRKDFVHKLAICSKEAKESKHFLRLLVRSEKTIWHEGRNLMKEANELTLIFNSIINKTKSGNA